MSQSVARRWSKEFKRWFWRTILRMWKSRIPKENVACLAEIARDMRLAKVTARDTCLRSRLSSTSGPSRLLD